jgi:hypothetical protein
MGYPPSIALRKIDVPGVNPNRRSRSVREALGPYLATIICSIGHHQPLETLKIVVNLIAATHTTTGLEVHAWLDEKDYPLKIKVRYVELEAVNIHRNKFHGEWNYEIRPQS